MGYVSKFLEAIGTAAAEVVALYHQRWELELGYDEIKTEMLLSAFEARGGAFDVPSECHPSALSTIASSRSCRRLIVSSSAAR